MELTKEELKDINGGTMISAALFNAIVRGSEFLLGLGRSLGTSIRRYFSRNYC